MAKFPDLLKRTYADCNKAGKPLGIAVLIIGVVTIALTFLLWGTFITNGVAVLNDLLGPDAASQVAQEFRNATPGSPKMQEAMMGLMQQLQMKTAEMPEKEKAMLIGQSFSRLLVNILPLAIGFGIFTMIVQLWYHAFCLMVGVKGNKPFGTLAGEALAWMLPLLGLGILMVLLFAALFVCVGILVGILSLLQGTLGENAVGVLTAIMVIAAIVAFIILWIRLSFASVILVQDKTGIIQSLQRSFRLTQRYFWRVLGNIVGLFAMIWIVTFVAQFFINVLVQVTSQFSPAAMAVGQLITFVSLLTTAYATVFMVRLKESLATSKK